MILTDFLLARIAEDEAVARAAVVRNGATWSTADLSDGTRITGATEFGNPRSYRGDAQLWDDEGAMGMFTETATHVVRWDPARVLAECEAKRRIVEPWKTGWTDDLSGSCSRSDEENWRYGIHADAHDAVLRLLALPYADHPDYREEWRP